MSDFAERIRAAAERELYRLSDLYSDDVARQMSAGLSAILDLHKPNESGNGCVICSRVESCGCVSAADLANCSKYDWPCATVVALGAMFGVEYVPPPTPEPQEASSGVSFEQVLQAWWDRLLWDFVEGAPLPESPSAMELAAQTAEANQAVLDKARASQAVLDKARAALDPDVVRMATEAASGTRSAHARRLGEAELSVSTETDFRNDQVKMTIKWRP